MPWKRENAYRRRFSLVMGQKNQLWWDLPAQESFRLHKEIYRIDADGFDRRLDELTELLEVKDLVGQACPRTVARRTHADGVDRGVVAQPRPAPARRTHHRARCRLAT